MIEQLIILFGWVCLGVMLVFVKHYSGNMDKKFRLWFWLNNAIFLFLRAIGATLLHFSFMDKDNFLFFNLGVTLYITVYMCRYLHYNYGKMAIKKKSDIDLLGAISSHFDSSKKVIFVKEYNEKNKTFTTIYVNDTFNRLIHKPNGQPDFDCVGKTNAYFGDLAKIYDKQDYGVYVKNIAKFEETEYVSNGKKVKSYFYKEKFGNYLLGEGFIVEI